MDKRHVERAACGSRCIFDGFNLTLRRLKTSRKNSYYAYIIIACLVFSISLDQTYAKPKVSFKRKLIQREDAFPQEYDFYPLDDMQRDMKLTVESMMGLYLVDPPRRHKSEFTQIKRDEIHFHIWRPIGERDRQQLWSEAAGWLVLGRIKYSTGARGLFSEIPNLKRVMLSFHEVVRPDKKGRRRSTKPDEVYTYLTLMLKRDKFELIDIDYIRSCALNFDCDQKARRMFILVKFNTRYLKKKR